MPVRSHWPLCFWLICLISFSIYIVMSAEHLPEKVAQHFDLNGKANGWATRDTYVIQFLSLGCGVSAGTVGLLYAMRFFPARFLNVPRPDYWRQPANYQKACDILLQFGYVFSGLFLMWLAAVHALLVQANQSTPPVLNNLKMMSLTGALLLATTVWVAALFWVFTRKVNDDETTAA